MLLCGLTSHDDVIQLNNYDKCILNNMLFSYIIEAYYN